MNKLVHIAAAGTLLAFSAAAQEQEALAKKLRAEAEANIVQLKTVGAVRGMTIKGAPYSAEEINETNQMLADGTRIHRENRSTVYRDGEGRTRRETPDSITITDPVGNVTYLLNPKTMTGQKLAMASSTFFFVRPDTPGVAMRSSGGESTFSISTSSDGPATITVNGVPMDEKAVAEAMAKAKASGSPATFTYERHEITTTGTSSSSSSGSGVGVGVGTRSGSVSSTARAGGGVMMAQPATRVMMKRNAGESLGKQMVEGVNAEGMREVTTIETGSIGNDRPIQITNESWYSDELQMMISSKRSDPRTGDETFRMTNIRRGEPGAYLFQAPTGYQITEPKSASAGQR